ncbi:MAG: alginate lyase family protein [Vicinamibacterales bacterium]
MIARRLQRLRRMTARELRWRATTALRTGTDRLGAALRSPGWDRRELPGRLAAPSPALRNAVGRGDWALAQAQLRAALAEQPPRFVIAPTMRAGVTARIASTFPKARRDATQRAERVMRGEFDLLGFPSLRFGPSPDAPDWHLDPVHQRRAPMRFWSTVPFLEASCGDHKIIWELNRQQYLLVLGRAYWLTGDEQYRTRALSLLASWMHANPPRAGINWASMLELAFRSLSWLWAIHFFAGQDQPADEPWLVDVLLALDRQLEHIERNLSYYFSPNTHLLGEALALYVAGQSMPLLASASRYAATGRRVLIAQMEAQIARDGGHAERSTHYHRYTLDFYILALAVARITGDAVAVEAFGDAVSRLGGAARLLSDHRGRLPHIGDDDGGMLLPICGRVPDDIRDSLMEAAVLVNRPDFRVGDPPEEAFWMLAHPTLAPLLQQARALPAPEGVASAALPETGYYVSRSRAGDHLVVDAGPHGFANGGHAHADALSLTLGVRGVPLLIDPGTGSYTADAAARDRFRSSALHNTLLVDGRSQSTPAGPFQWASTASATAHIWRTGPGFDYLDASHDGYAPLLHRRHVLALHGDLLIVADLVEGTGTHEACVHWHLDPRWSADVTDRRALLRTAAERVELAVSSGRLERLTGGTGSPDVGWHAPVYGRIEPTSTLRISVRGPAPLWLVSVFGMNPSNEVLHVEPVPIWTSAGAFGGTFGVRVARAHSIDHFGLATPRPDAPGARTAGGDTWRIGRLETDARMLFCRTSGAVSRLALVDGSLVRSTDRHSLQVTLPEVVPDLHMDFARLDGGEVTAAHMSRSVMEASVRINTGVIPTAVERRATARGSARRPSLAVARNRMERGEAPSCAV